MVDNVLNEDIFNLLTDQQQAKLARWSIQFDKTVLQLLADCMFMAEEYETDSKLMLEGTLPSGLYGGMLPDGSTHT